MTTLPADELVERLNKRAETYNTGVAVNPESCGTLGYYSSHDANLDRKVAAEISSLRAKLAEAMEVLWRLARLELPDRPRGNAGIYSIFHDDIRAARRLIEGNGNEH